jgi:hypothetical protein
MGRFSPPAADETRSGQSQDWLLKFKNPNAVAVKREAEEEWGHSGSRRMPPVKIFAQRLGLVTKCQAQLRSIIP